MVLLAAQVMAFALAAPPCIDICPDGGPLEECSSVCIVCGSCANAQKALSSTSPLASPMTPIHAASSLDRICLRPGAAGDILHVPLFG